jgi:hypothetical protein
VILRVVFINLIFWGKQNGVGNEKPIVAIDSTGWKMFLFAD